MFGRCHRLQNEWEVPYAILERMNDVVYQIRSYLRSKKIFVRLHHLATYVWVIGMSSLKEKQCCGNYKRVRVRERNYEKTLAPEIILVALFVFTMCPEQRTEFTTA